MIGGMLPAAWMTGFFFYREGPLLGKADIQTQAKSIGAASKSAPNERLGRIWSDGRRPDWT